MKSGDQQEKKQESPFERFVRAIAGVPKAEADEIAEREKRERSRKKTKSPA